MAPTSTNRWDLLDPPDIGQWTPRLRATVVIPYFEALPQLRRTLVGLSHQTYPGDLTDIVIVDDGSEKPLVSSDIDDLSADAVIINREDEGFRLATARNEGAAVSRGDVLVFLDADMIPEPVWLESHMRWHHVEKRAVVLGPRSHIDSDWLTETVVGNAMANGSLGPSTSGHTVEVPEWIEFHLLRTGDLTSDDDDIFRVVTGGNMSITREFFDELGGYDDSFVRWGAEDTEVGYRAWIRGGLLIPEERAHCWHQGLGVTPDPSERESQELQRRKLAHLIPHHSFRDSTQRRTWKRPRIVAGVVGEDSEAILSTCVALLEIPDLVVVLDQDQTDTILTEELGPEPRVGVAKGPLRDEEPFTPFFLEVPTGLTPSPDLVAELVEVARRKGSARTSDGLIVDSRRHINTAIRTETLIAGSAANRRQFTRARRVVQRLQRIRTVSDAWAALRWVLGALRRRLPSTQTTGRKRPQRSPIPTPKRLLSDPWTRIVAIDLPSLPASGHMDQDRIDLVVTAEEADQDTDGPRRLSLASTDDASLLAASPLEPGAALKTIRGERPAAAPLEMLLQGVAPEEAPPGPRTGPAIELAKTMTPGDLASLEAIRRAVVAEHLNPMRLNQLCTAAGLPPSAPTVSVVMATRRPDRVLSAVQAVKGQSYPYLELILAAHGFDLSDEVIGMPNDSELRFEVVTYPDSEVFGSVLAGASKVASGKLITKMDDDDLYSRSHVEDLVNAYLLSGADLVGKAAEFVYLEHADTTIRRFVGGAYTDSRTIGGGAIALTREMYDSAGGWADVTRHVDQALIRDVVAAGGSIFRTHGLGYVLVRHDDHTWQTDESRFLDQAEERWPGLPEWILAALPPDAGYISR